MKFFGRRNKRDTSLDTPAQPVLALREQVRAPVILSGAGFNRLRDCVVVYSNFRAGSHLLQSSLAAVTALFDADEVFARRTDTPHSFNAFVASAEADHPALLIEPESQLPRYFQYLFDQVNHDAPLILSLKYTQAHRLGADDVTAVPLVLKALADYRVPVLHLVRRDVVQQAISHLVATETGQFHTVKPNGSDGDRKIWLDPVEVASLARAKAEEQRRAQAHLAALSARHLTVYYEELAPGKVADELRRALRFLDRYAHVPSGFRPATHAMESDRRVANRVEILDHLLARAPDLLHSLSG